jgi:hypothetical protein
MTTPGGSDSEMPTFPWPPRPDVSALDALLAGTRQPEEAPADLRAVGEVLAALRAPADQREVASWEQALITYREVARAPQAPSRSHRRRPRRGPRRVAPPLSPRFAAAACVVVVALLGGGIAAAYTASLPSTLQKIAHDTIAAPNVRENRAAATPDGPVEPLAEGSASYRTDRASRGTGRTSHVRDHASHARGSTSGIVCHAFQQAVGRGNAGQEGGVWPYLVPAGSCTGYRGRPQRSAQPSAGPQTGPPTPPGQLPTPIPQPSYATGQY